MNGLIGRKLGMTRVFDAAGTHVPVTVIEAGPCPVVAVLEGRVELGFGAKKPKNAPKALAGHAKKGGVETTPRIIRRFDVTGEAPGARNTTELGLRVVRIDAERNLLFVRGSVPGPMNGLVTVRKQGGPSRHD